MTFTGDNIPFFNILRLLKGRRRRCNLLISYVLTISFLVMLVLICNNAHGFMFFSTTVNSSHNLDDKKEIDKLASDIVSQIKRKSPGVEENILKSLENDEQILKVFSVVFERLSMNNEVLLMESASRILEISDDTPVAALAVDHYLEACKHLYPEQFLKRCNSFIDTAPRSSKSRVALLKRYHWQSNKEEYLLAAKDALLFWSLWPEKVNKLSLRESFLGTIIQAGFRLESEWISKTNYSSQLANIFLNRICIAKNHSMEERENSSSEENADDLLENLFAISSSLRNSFDSEDKKKISSQSQKYSEVINRIIKNPVTKIGDVQLLCELNLFLYEYANKSLAIIHQNTENKKNLSGFITDYYLEKQPLENLANTQCDIFQSLLELCPEENSEDASVFTRNAVSFALENQRLDAAESIYKVFIEKYNGTEVAAHATLFLADLYEKRFNVTSRALDAFASAAEQLPNTSFLHQYAILRQAALLENQDHCEEASAILHELLENNQENDFTQVAIQILEKCGSRSNMTE